MSCSSITARLFRDSTYFVTSKSFRQASYWKNRKPLMIVGAMILHCASPQQAWATQACSFWRDKCLARVEAMKEQSAKSNTPFNDPTFSRPLICENTFNTATQTGVWPQLGPYLAIRCAP